MVLGNHGALYQEDSEVRWDDPAGPVRATIQEAVAQALRSSEPVHVNAGTVPLQ
jgi:hypothetical protein